MSPNNSENFQSDSCNSQENVVSDNIQQYNDNNFHYDTQVMQPQLPPQQAPQIPIHLNKFFYQPSNDFFNYHIECEKISDDYIIQLLNRPFNIMQLKENDYRYTFFYKQLSNDQIYQISCEIASPSLINDCLNRSFYCAKIEQNMKQEQFAFTSSYQKDNLENDLKIYLSKHFFC